jgi:peptidoglycan/LPS O-acetylase OafA/YrhL
VLQVRGMLSSIPEKLKRVTNSGSYVPQIDGLRFIAIFLVLIYHGSGKALKYYAPAAGSGEALIVEYLPNGIAGVELFFFISGLIISYPFLSGAKPSLGAFYKRRLLRLEPPYILVLTLCFFGLAVLGLKPEAAPQFEMQEMPLWQSYLTSIFYMHGTIYGMAPRLNPPLWSLEIEVVFYLIAPLIIYIYLKIHSFRNRIIFGLLAVAGGIISQSVLVTYNYALYYVFITHTYAFLMGILVSDWTARHSAFYTPRGRIFDGVWLAGAALILISAVLHHGELSVATYAGLLAIRAIAIFCLFLGSAWGPVASRLMGLPWLALLGGACYSIYLTHVPVINVAGTLLFKVFQPQTLGSALLIAGPLLILSAFAVGMVFYILIERPCMRRDWPQALWRYLRQPKRLEPVSD